MEPKPEKPRDARPTTIRLPRAWHKALKHEAAERDTTITVLIKEALRARFPDLPPECATAG